MTKCIKLKLVLISFLAVFSSGCALAVADQMLGDKKATHADDQTVESAKPDDNNFSKDAQ